MPSISAYARFLESMKITYEKWHDGIPYDLDALDELTEIEQDKIEKLLISKRSNDWRDIEALARIGSPPALSALRENLNSKSVVIKLESAKHLVDRNLLPDIDTIIAEAIPQARIGEGLVEAMSLAEKYPTEKVRRALLKCCFNGHSDLRAHCAALLFFLYGVSQSSFDWNYRPFFLKFNEEDALKRKLAFDELCQTIGVDAN